MILIEAEVTDRPDSHHGLMNASCITQEGHKAIDLSFLNDLFVSLE